MTLKQWFFIFIFLFTSALHAEREEYLDVKLFMSVDWEGVSLQDENLQAMKLLRNQFPHIKLIHFLNAAYFTQKGVNPIDVVAKIQSVLRPGDEIGLHVHALESLLAASGVPFRDNVTYWGSRGSQPYNGQRGHDVPLSLFNVEELRRIIRKSLEILGSHGFSNINSFRAGGWVATPEVLEALRLEGIQIDSSAVPLDIIGSVVGSEQPLFQINKKLWPDQTPFKHQPYELQTPVGPILEFPNNIGLADYIDSKKAFLIFQKLVEKNYGKPQPVSFHFGFHQETASLFLPRVRNLLRKIDFFQQSYRVRVRSVIFSDIPPQFFRLPLREAKSCAASLK
ncbi:MAG: hypothetical protein RJB66_957 [Pseudomonadota bacterium]|jgi:hypothetical protein